MRSVIGMCLARPVTVTAACMLVAVLAVVAYVRLPVSLLPDLQYPELVVWTAYPDVPPERVERAVTERVEMAVAGVVGVQRITSRSLLGGSLVRLEFGWNANLDLAFLDVREQLDRLGNALPDEASRPAVLRINPNDRPIMMIAMQPAAEGAEQGERQDLVGMKRLAREVAARRLEALPDVARVEVAGGHEPRIEVIVDPGRLAAHDLSLEALSAALRAANVALPGGVIRRGPFRYAVELSGEFVTPADIEQTIVRYGSAGPVRLADVATVRETVEERLGLVRLDSQETLLLLVERRPDANTVRAAAEVRLALNELTAELSGIAFQPVVDESRFIEQAIAGVRQAVLLGGFLAIIILFVFLRRPRALLAVAVAVPLSLGISLILFDFLGVSFNLISLSGLALGVGMLVDNAIVVVENIARLREEGRAPLEAAREGTAEVIGAITASTLTTIAVFLPITMVEGLAGRLFRDQSLAVVCSLLASLLVAATVVPLLAAGKKEKTRPDAQTMPGMALYERALKWSLDHKGIVLTGAALFVTLGMMVMMGLPREVIPEANQGRVNIHFALPADADLPLVSARSEAIETRSSRLDGVSHILADLGERDEARLNLDPRPVYEGDILLILDEDASSDAVIEAASAIQQSIDFDLELSPIQTQLEAMLVRSEADLYIDLEADQRQEAERSASAVLDALQNRPELTNVRRADVDAVPAYQVTFRHDVMARFGVRPEVLTAYLEAGARGRRATELRTVNEDIPIVIRSRHVASLEALLDERIPAASGLLPVRSFVEVESVMLPAALIRSGQRPVVRLEADLPSGGSLVTAEETVNEVLGNAVPVGVRGRMGGATDAFREGLRAVGWSLLISLLLVFLILAAQFESLVQPLIILLTVPMALAGVAFTLCITGHSLNLMSLTGGVVLVGIVVNDAIIKVDFINQRRKVGKSMMEAVMEAGRQRLRPILMTTFTTALGLLPLALGLGVGAELRAPLAIVVLGGILFATALTLLVVPVSYAFIHRMSTN